MKGFDFALQQADRPWITMVIKLSSSEWYLLKDLAVLVHIFIYFYHTTVRFKCLIFKARKTHHQYLWQFHKYNPVFLLIREFVLFTNSISSLT